VFIIIFLGYFKSFLSSLSLSTLTTKKKKLGEDFSASFSFSTSFSLSSFFPAFLSFFLFSFSLTQFFNLFFDITHFLNLTKGWGQPLKLGEGVWFLLKSPT